MVVLGLDPASKCGWAVAGYKIHSGVWTLWDTKADKGEAKGVRYLRLLECQEAVQDTASLDLIVYEQAHHRGAAATEYAYGYATHVQSFCARHNIPFAKVHSGTVKKFATGSGKASKEEMVEAARARWSGFEPETDDEADARFIALWGLEEYTG